MSSSSVNVPSVQRPNSFVSVLSSSSKKEKALMATAIIAGLIGVAIIFTLLVHYNIHEINALNSIGSLGRLELLGGFVVAWVVMVIAFSSHSNVQIQRLKKEIKEIEKPPETENPNNSETSFG